MLKNLNDLQRQGTAEGGKPCTGSPNHNRKFMKKNLERGASSDVISEFKDRNAQATTYATRRCNEIEKI